MESVIRWSASSGDENAEINLAAISDWWAGLEGSEIVWQQRELLGGGEPVDWQPQSLDERFVILSPQLKGITLFWRKPDQPIDHTARNITVSSLELDLNTRTLTAQPASGRQYLLRVTSPKVVFREIKLDNPLIGVLKTPSGGAVLLCRDESQTLEVQITLDAANLQKLVVAL